MRACGQLLLRLQALLLLLLAGLPAAAATYNYSSDSFAWETAANAVTWDRTCTGYQGDDDKATVTLTGGFQFRFAGTNYTSVRILANGMLQFGADTGFHRNYTNTTLPAGSATARSGCVAGATVNTLMAYWTDLNPSQAGSGNVTWEQKGTAPNRRLVVSWNNVYQYNTSTPYAFQVILYEGGEFKYQYGNGNATGAKATIGVQVSSSDYTLYSYNSGYNANGSAVRWSLTNTDPARVAEYRFDEYAYTGRVGEVRDSSGNARHGLRIEDAASHASGRVCRALEVPANTDSSIDGVDTLVNVASTLGERGSVSLWWRYTNAWSGGTAAMLFDASGQSNRPFFLQRDAGGALRMSVSDSAGTALTLVSPVQGFGAGQWVHLAVSWRLAAGSNQSTLRLYVNGSLMATSVGTTSGQLAPATGSLFVGDARLGAAPNGGTAASANGRIDELRIYNYDIGPGEVLIDQSQTHLCLPPLDHVQIEHGSGSGLTCTPSTLTLRACANPDCSVPYTDGVIGTLSASAGATVVWPDGEGFTIPAGQSSTTNELQLTIAGAVQLSASVASASGASTCNFGSPSCRFSAADAGLLLTFPDHRAETQVQLSVTAVRKSDNSAVCVPAFGNVSRNLSFSCSYANPSSGTLPVRLNNQALNASGNTAAACGTRSLSASFDANGQANLNMLYADAGRITVSAQYSGSGASGDAGLVMTGSSSAVAAPTRFVFDAAAGTRTAGVAFSARVGARNAVNAVMPNFGRESGPAQVQLSRVRLLPVSGGYDPALRGTDLVVGFSAGVASPANLIWDEVGRIDLKADLVGGSYLGSGLNVSGQSPGDLGEFRPSHLALSFPVPVAPACAPAFRYAGEPFAVRVEARNAGDVTTINYAGALARGVTLDERSPLNRGSLSQTTIAANSFVAGVAELASLRYSYTSKTGSPGSLVLRGTDDDGVVSKPGAEPAMPLRSGRLQLQSASGYANQVLSLPLRLEHWNGNAWVLAHDDVCTAAVLSAGVNAALAQSGRVNIKGESSAGWSSPLQSASLSQGFGQLRLSATATGAVDVALNLGDTNADRACLAGPRPATVGLKLPWLRARQGSLHGCVLREDSDPSARASFGAATMETQRRVHERQID
jgi:MSHA biogenesis protein MshQ